MHLLNAWLPPPVAEQTHLEIEAFSKAVRLLQHDCSPVQLADTPYASLKWISVFNNFLKSKSDLALYDIEIFITVILRLFLHRKENYYLQVRWGRVLYKYLKKFSKKLSIVLDWRSFYDAFMHAVFLRRTSFEGFYMQARYSKILSNVVCKCRRYFSEGSAAEIWAQFRPMLNDLSHNASLEALGFISLFLPTNPEQEPQFFTSEWFAECLRLWDGVTYCQYWNSQWLSLVGRCIRNNVYMPHLHLEPFVPALFSQFLRSFEVPVAKTSGVFPYQREVTREIILAFPSEWSHSIPKNVAKSIVYLLQPNGSAQRHLSCLVDLLEQYYHPSNGGPWTTSLERFLRHTVVFFLKRLADEDRKHSYNVEIEQGFSHFLTEEERKRFVEIILRLIKRGQYSKSSSLAYTSAKALSELAYFEPILVLPTSIRCFYTALSSVTATHQLHAAIKILALSARTLLMGSAINIEFPVTYPNDELVLDCKRILESAMFDLLSGLDANDPPKTTATLQFFCSIFSSLEIIRSDADDSSSLLVIDWSKWLDEFLGRLFSLLLHLESDNHIHAAVEGEKPLFGKSFLVRNDSFYQSVLQVLFSRLTLNLYRQALRSIAKFVHNHTVSGAAAEIGLLCSAIVYANPSHGISELMKPIMTSVLSSLKECTSTGVYGIPSAQAASHGKASISPAMEMLIVYQLNVISLGLMYSAEHVIQYEDLVRDIMNTSFAVPSGKVNEAGSHFLSAILQTVTVYYPLNQYRISKSYSGLDGIEEWISMKVDSGIEEKGPLWHLPSQNEVSFANELLEMHLKAALVQLQAVCSESYQGDSGNEKEQLRVLLLRINGSLRGVGSCLPEFMCSSSKSSTDEVQPHFMSGAAGAAVGSAYLREAAAETLHLACNYFLSKWSDDIFLLSLLADSIAAVGNPGSLEYSEWISTEESIKAELESLSEHSSNHLTGHFVKGRKRPKWLIIERVFSHTTWRASQSQYNQYRISHESKRELPKHIFLIMEDLTRLSLHNYDAVRKIAATSMTKFFKRYPSSISQSIPALLTSLKDPLVPEHEAIGSCALLSSRPITRQLTEDFCALSDFFLAVLNSAHQKSMKAQSAITELFQGFMLRFAGLPMHNDQNITVGSSASYASLVTEIQVFCSKNDFTHWRYNMMAQGMLILLSARGSSSNCCQGNHDFHVQSSIQGHFLHNLKSDFPPVRLMSLGILLFLLQKSSNKQESNICSEDNNTISEESSSLKQSVITLFSQEKFGNTVFRNISVDHHFTDEHSKSHQITTASAAALFGDSSMSIVKVLGQVRSWPRTRTADVIAKGEGFSPNFAKFFKRLVQTGGSTVLNSFRAPLEEATRDPDDRGIQCAAAEAIAGFLHSDVDCVLKSWDDWLQPLFKQLTSSCSVETTTEWAACIRFAATGKCKLGKRSPLIRPMLLRCLLEPLPASASSNTVVKHFTFASAALWEIPPSEESLDEIPYNQCLLEEALKFVRHSAPQVREVIGLALCVTGTNIESLNSLREFSRLGEFSSKGINSIDMTDWKASIISQTLSEVLKCQRCVIEAKEVESINNISLVMNGQSVSEETVEMEDAVRLTETETSHKDLSALAKVAMQFLKFQVFPQTHISKSVSAILAAANDSNWHTRIASLNFIQAFVYRHTFLLPVESSTNIWNTVKALLSDPQVEVKELASITLTGIMKGFDEQLFCGFCDSQLEAASKYLNELKRGRKSVNVSETGTDVHAVVLGMSSCIQSVPYDMPSWLPKMVTTLLRFSKENSAAIRATVRKCLSEFRRTHSDAWSSQKHMFNEEELELLADTSSPASYFA
ncbi:hypothetical protein KP509_28G034600 [Ceratopteris richardii]|uniref:Proteasome activator subunit 4 n=1 Tax=Ceratopteris richardii TaxID=49495 RepID=A0A8T2RCD8_CERRI|nr:hypothetical protein KP509_28G034600 [Ceratopteris richardii]